MTTSALTLLDSLTDAALAGDVAAALALADYVAECGAELTGDARLLAEAGRRQMAGDSPLRVFLARVRLIGRLARDRRTGRIRTRRVSAESVAQDCAWAQAEKGGWRFHCRNGGDVCNTYGYPAETEAVLAVCDPQGRTVVWAAQLPANKVTSGGAAAACLMAARDVFDGRCGAARKQAAREAVMAAHRAAVAAGDVYLICVTPGRAGQGA